mgnify:CR=1 FL=1
MSQLTWNPSVEPLLQAGNYEEAATFYEREIEANPEETSNYWYLGLIFLLQGQEAEAQMTWLSAMAEGEPDDVDRSTEELAAILQAEADRRKGSDLQMAWVIRQHVRELVPTRIDNLLELVRLSIALENFTGEELKEWGIIELLHSGQGTHVNRQQLAETLAKVLQAVPLHSTSPEFAEACERYIQKPFEFFEAILPELGEISDSLKQPALAARIVSIFARLAPDNTTILRYLTLLYQSSGDYDRGLEVAQSCYDLAPDTASRVFANYLILNGLMRQSGRWDDIYPVRDRHQELLTQLVREEPKNLDYNTARFLFGSNFYSPYIQDTPRQYRELQNKIARICQDNFRRCTGELSKKYRVLLQRRTYSQNKPIKIGYLSHCLRRHSVGWLARWLFQHHDRDRFELYGYFLQSKGTNDPLQQWYFHQVRQHHRYGSGSTDTIKLAEQIHHDEIDILVDLDSLTQDTVCAVLSLRPAPVQVTWLGWDAAGIPAIDYFIADPYVLPETADDYYSEKIWRLPQTYIAVDGFEMSVPTLTRETLDIPNDAVIYFSTQKGLKQHPDTVRLQLRILKQVPNSYLLIKSIADRQSIETFFNQLAEETNIESDRIKFLPQVPLSATHRANLAIADVVLDTYPYNGATTTLETLWVGVPLVTRVGEQFSSRNSYTMMTNAGISEGIARTDEEYIEWGVRLGRDPQLRQQIAWKLRQSRQTSPLWNGEQFTREMENAYEQMWQRYLESR